ncbi:MAG: hypothetical protein ACKOC8_00665 [Pirellulales bacterium]
MNAQPLLSTLLAALQAEHLEVVLIGNAAAAMHGAPVTTLDFDFMFRDTAVNLTKLKRVARALEATILRPFYPVSRLYRLEGDTTGLQADFMPVIHGVKSFEGLRDRAVERDVGGMTLLVASLDDIIASKKAAGRERDIARKDHQKKGPDARGRSASRSRQTALAALAAESDRQLDDLIRRRLALPLEKRMNFLRKRLPGGGSCL